MSEDQSTTPPAVAPDHPGPPPLRIHHVFAATIVTAVLLVCSASYLRAIDNGLGIALHTLSLVALSLAITCLAFNLAWRCCGKSSPVEPGDGLLLLQIPHLVFVLLMVVQAAYFQRANAEGQIQGALDPARSSIVRWFENWSDAIISGAELLICIVCVIWLVRQLAWRFLFVVVTIAMMIQLFVTSRWALYGRTSIPWSDRFEYAVLYLVPAVAAIVALFIAVASDVWYRSSRHWPHWCGVIVFALQTFITLVVFGLATWREW